MGAAPPHLKQKIYFSFFFLLNIPLLIIFSLWKEENNNKTKAARYNAALVFGVQDSAGSL
jgi:uncharacterized membrane-anchored protein YitT (DUF2179 family)